MQKIATRALWRRRGRFAWGEVQVQEVELESVEPGAGLLAEAEDQIEGDAWFEREVAAACGPVDRAAPADGL